MSESVIARCCTAGITCPYQLFIRSEIACFFLAPGSRWRAMKKLWQTLFQKLTAALREHGDAGDMRRTPVE
jgi:hypothetical protein